MEIAVRPAAVMVDDILAPADEMEEERLKIGGTIRQRLTEVSEREGGEVRLHGRLVAQWLYYVFLRCAPFTTKLASCPDFRRWSTLVLWRWPSTLPQSSVNTKRVLIGCQSETRE